MKEIAVSIWRVISLPLVLFQFLLEWERLSFRPKLKIKKGRGTHIDALVWLQNGQNIQLGDNVKISSFCCLFAGGVASIRIGSDSMLGPGCAICAMNHGMVSGPIPYRSQPWEDSLETGIVIGCNVWLGAHCIVLPGAVIEDGAVIAAGSVVSGHVAGKNLFYQKRTSSRKSLG